MLIALYSVRKEIETGAGVEMGVGVEIALMVVLGAVMGLVVDFGSEELSEAEQAVVVAPD